MNFGKGFYITQDEFLAKKWACKKRYNQPGSFVSYYTLNVTGLKIYEFGLDEEWLSFVADNRENARFDPKYEEYDILAGVIADDKMFSIFEKYALGGISAENAIKIMNNMDYGLQYVLRTQKAVEALHFEKSKELKGLEKQNLESAFQKDTISGAQKADEMIQRLNRGLTL